MPLCNCHHTRYQLLHPSLRLCSKSRYKRYSSMQLRRHHHAIQPQTRHHVDSSNSDISKNPPNNPSTQSPPKVGRSLFTHGLQPQNRLAMSRIMKVPTYHLGATSSPHSVLVLRYYFLIFSFSQTFAPAVPLVCMLLVGDSF